MIVFSDEIWKMFHFAAVEDTPIQKLIGKSQNWG